MRVHLKLSPNKDIVPFNYHESLVSAFHKWLGENNDLHDNLSLYSLSWLNGATANRNGLEFNKGATWFISAHDNTIIQRVINGINSQPIINYGMHVKEIIIQEEPRFEMKESYFLASPIFIKRTIADRTKYFMYDDLEASDLMTETLKNKLSKAGLSNDNIKVEFDSTYPNPTSKMISYKGIKCRASLCPVIISGSQEQVAFAWNVGIGNSTGIGFGALK